VAAAAESEAAMQERLTRARADLTHAKGTDPCH
jgi:hypothetical protein